MSLPAWIWRWAAWMLGHNFKGTPPFDYRPYGPKNFNVRPGYPVPPPGQIPQNVKDWYYKTFAAEIAALKDTPPPVIVPASPVMGRCGFTNHDPLVAVRKFRGLIKTVAVHADGVNKDGEPYVTRNVLEELVTAGFRVIPWFSWDGPILSDVKWLHGIGQAEGPGQMDAVLQKLHLLCDGELAIVTNNFSTWFPENFFALSEAYMNTNPNAQPGAVVQDAINRGAKRDKVSPVFGCYVSDTEEAIDVPLQTYTALWNKTNFWIFMLETLPDRDINYLRTL